MSKGFYDAIAKYYDYIFPAEQAQVTFLENAMRHTPSRILDVACGSGSYAEALATAGYAVVAVDLDETMVACANAKAAEWTKNHIGSTGDFSVAQADMLDLSKSVTGAFDLIFCIGNSIVHLGGLEEIKSFLLQAKCMLSEDGKAIFQIINFDRIFSKQISTLPTIFNQEIDLSFERNYYYERDSGKVMFHTLLRVGTWQVTNTIPLFPLFFQDFSTLLKESGYEKIEVFGDFQGTEYNVDTSYMLVVKAETGGKKA
ncbi:MAG: class I SAM-dependent methyltransferase [Clostridia bacterium]